MRFNEPKKVTKGKFKGQWYIVAKDSDFIYLHLDGVARVGTYNNEVCIRTGFFNSESVAKQVLEEYNESQNYRD